MDDAIFKHYEARAQILKSLAHPSRLFIIEKLQEKERSVGELTQLIGADTSTVSKHLSVLKNTGLVYPRREGTTIYYALKTPCILNFMDCVEEVLVANADEHARIASTCRVC